MNDTTTISPLLNRLDCIIKKYPKQLAVIDGSLTLTYSQLSLAANALANVLFQLKCPIGLFMERSAGSVLAAVALARAGIPYIPLGMDWPDARLSRMIERYGITALLAVPSTVKNRSWADRISLIDPTEFFDAQAHELPCPTPSPETLLYIMHTSGSTGEPKGVRIHHAGVHAIFTEVSHLGYVPGQCMAYGASLTFDMSIMEMWGGLLNGCALVITRTETLLDATSLKSQLALYGIKFLVLPTSVFNILSAQNPSIFQTLEHLCFAGEMPNSEAVNRIRSACPELILHNCYGPTECSAIVATETISNASFINTHVATGKPIGNTRFVIIDANGQPVPTGEEGELLIVGSCVGLGYTQEKQKTDSSPFILLPDKNRAYKSGDRAVLTPDGTLLVLGRLDDQIKISGCRTEPGEVCAAILKSPLVRLAYVGVVRHPEPALIAYIVPSQASGDEVIDTLRNFLHSQLPEYMVPQYIIAMNELPLNSNGKIDIARLPAPSAMNKESGDPILDAFRSVLHDETFSFEDSFLEAGGSSIMAAKLIAALRKITGVAVPFHLIMAQRTASTIKLYVENAKISQAQAEDTTPNSEVTVRI